MVWKKMKHDLTTGTWQDDTGCPISIILVSTSQINDGQDGLVVQGFHHVMTARLTGDLPIPLGKPPVSLAIYWQLD